MTMYLNDKGYVAQVKRNLTSDCKPKENRAVMTRFLIKPRHTAGSFGIIHIKEGIVFPAELIGKWVRIKVEVVENETETDMR